MHTYDSPLTVTYSMGLIDFGDVTDVEYELQGPSGYRGKVREVMVNGKEVFTATTTEAAVDIGNVTTGQQFANCGLGTLADNACYVATANSGDIVTFETGGTSQIDADETVFVNMVATTGGTPTGQGIVYITIDWFV